MKRKITINLPDTLNILTYVREQDGTSIDLRTTVLDINDLDDGVIAQMIHAELKTRFRVYLKMMYKRNHGTPRRITACKLLSGK